MQPVCACHRKVCRPKKGSGFESALRLGWITPADKPQRHGSRITENPATITAFCLSSLCRHNIVGALRPMDATSFRSGNRIDHGPEVFERSVKLNVVSRSENKPAVVSDLLYPIENLLAHLSRSPKGQRVLFIDRAPEA